MPTRIEMHPLTPPLSTIQSLSESNSLRVTKERVQRQLKAVNDLLEHNSKYLESFEQSWIGHIISEASAVIFGHRYPTGLPETRSEPTHIHTDVSQGGRNIQGLGLQAWNSSRADAQDHARMLLATSRSLNSANSLLSCCHERWVWLQSLQAKHKTSQSIMDDFQELRLRRRQQRKRQSNTSSQPSEHIQSPYREGITSITSSPVAHTNNEGSENSLYLAVDDTVEKWRKNAEDALNDTTARLQSMTSFDESPVHEHSPEQCKCQQCLADHGTSSFVPTRQAEPLSTHNAERRSVYLAGTPSSHTLTDQDHFHRQVVDTDLSRSPHATNPRSRQFEIYPMHGTTFQAALKNSFDKEIIDIAAPSTNTHVNSRPLPARTSRMYSASSYNSQQRPVDSTRPSIMASTILPRDSNTNGPLGVNSGENSAFNQFENSSRLSVHSRSSTGDQAPRSRGRRWLEQKSDISLQQPNSARRLVS